MESFRPEIDNFDKYIKYFDTLEHVPYDFLNAKHNREISLEGLKIKTVKKSRDIYSEIIELAEDYDVPYEVFSKPDDSSKDIKRKISEHTRPEFDKFIYEFESMDGVTYELLDEVSQKSSEGTVLELKNRIGRYFLLKEFGISARNSILIDIARECDTARVFIDKMNIIGANILGDDKLDFTKEVMSTAKSIGVVEDVFNSKPRGLKDVDKDKKNDDTGAEDIIEILLESDEGDKPDDIELVHFGSEGELQSLLGEE